MATAATDTKSAVPEPALALDDAGEVQKAKDQAAIAAVVPAEEQPEVEGEAAEKKT